jgi:exopolyphosphatase/guanosine-5'-triphosphate,3'-diphosphate pyrophosphatase
LIYKCPFPHGKQTIKLELDPFLKSLDELIFSTLEERNQNDFIIPIRKKMAPFAAVKTRWVMRQLNVREVIISPFSLKEGALL